MIAGSICVTIFWISWVTIFPSDKTAMSMFVSVEELLDKQISKRTKLGGLVKTGSIQISEFNQLDCDFILKKVKVNYPSDIQKLVQIYLKMELKS